MLFDRNIEPSCSYCRHGNSISESEVACVKRGIVERDSFCRKFKYDPLKREPEQPLILDTHDLTEEDFAL